MIDRDGRDRAVSDTVGFVLVFGLVAAVIAIAFTGGLAGLETTQQAEQANNVERAFEVLAYNFEDVSRRGAPSRTTELNLGGGELSYDDRTRVSVQLNGDEPIEIRPDPLVYTSPSGTRIVYEAGAVIRTNGDASVMTTEPGFVIDDARSNLPLFRTTKPPGGASVGGEGTALVRGSIECRSAGCSGTDRSGTVEDGGTVTVAVTSPRYDAWERYFQRFEDAGIGSIDTRNRTVEFTYETDRISVPVVRFRVAIRQ